LVIGTVGFLINEASVAIAQLNGIISNNSTTAVNSKDPDGKKIVLTWIESNDTARNVPMISVSHEDFWKTFGPLLKISTNGSVNTLE
jgi:hypothetical protein